MLLSTTGQPSEGMLAIKPDWDKREDGVSGYVSLNPDSDGQTVASGDTHNQGTCSCMSYNIPHSQSHLYQ